MQQRLRNFGFSIAALMLLGACVSIPSDFKDPVLRLQSITPRLSGGISPEFDIVLEVTNPNRVALEVDGLIYTLYLKGNKIVDGVASEIPSIAAYGKANVTVNARADLFAGISLLADLMNSPNEPLDFEFNAEIDVGTFYPTIKLNKKGSLALPQ